MDKGITTRVDILRHGLPEGHRCLRGHTDFAITATGLEQMTLAVAGLEDIEQVVCSPLQRCSHFAQTYARRFTLPCQESELWMEMNFGNWDGQPHDTLWQSHGQHLTDYWENPWQSTPHGGESLREFDGRIADAWKQLLADHAGKRILLVTHAGVMKQLMRILLEMPENAGYLQRIELPYAARYRVTNFTDANGQEWPQLQWPKEQQF
ncbi:histidine phosphatase family protein [Photobacterium ganghwense]|uniref:histidine phosphatase family protein n=1 Tax=Photobacterium ganghwense TaxID=320778 RepID=UPI000B0F6607|nr:histidine phosphatase family protein [Photobacterium ganghwense]PSU09862.1 histidine phosphatase family protein [Photobacterium ganghwense]QSV17109.1 histidine phosphatase family protein [Photobacterium ganghwense]